MPTQKNDLNQFDQLGTQTVEVNVLWGDSLLHVFHINKDQDFVLSRTKTKNDNQFVVGSNILGNLNQIPVVIHQKEQVRFIVIKDSKLEVEIDNVKTSLKDLIRSGRAIESTDFTDTYEIFLEPSILCRMNIGSLAITAKQVTQAKKIPYAKKLDKTMLVTSIGSALAGLAIITTTHLLVGATNSNILVQVNEDDRLNDLRAFIQRQREHQIKQQQQTNHNEQAAAASQSHSGPDGQMGNRQTQARNGRHAIRNNGEPPHLSRQAARDMVASRGIFVALGTTGPLAGGSSGIVSPFGGLTESGLENQNANGNMNGDNINDAFGFGGLGNSGTGWGANGNGEGVIGVGNLNTNGIGGNGTHGYGINHGSRLSNRGTRGPIVRASAPSVIGLLSPESIRRVVIRNLPQVIHCHEQGLVQNPTLEGRVVVRFIIGSEGTVMGSNIAESNIAVPSVGQCISNAVRRWQFPTPEGGGIVTVNYPFNLQRPE